MTETTNYKLKKPGASDNAQVDVLNGNMDVIDRELKLRATLGPDGKVPDVSAGTLGGQVQANAGAAAALGTAQVRNIRAGTADLTAGSSSLATGEIYLVYE